MQVRFAHMPDCHLGSWGSHPDLKDMPLLAFEKAIDACIKEKVDFILIAGDLFDTSLPPIDVLRKAASEFRRCVDKGIRVYAIPGSLDFSPTGKTMINVFEDAGLLTNVARFDEDDEKITLNLTEDKTGPKIAGMIGRRGSLEIEYFRKLQKVVEDGFKIFVFHSGLDEFKPVNTKNLVTVPASELPKGFDYYASGHIHERYVNKEKMIVFPGPLFPADFHELEIYDSGFFIADYDGSKINLTFKPVKLFDVLIADVKADGKNVMQIENEILDRLTEIKGKVVLLKVSGTLESGKQSDIDFKRITGKAVEMGALAVKKSVHITSKEFEDIEVKKHTSIDELELEIVKEYAKGNEEFSQGNIINLMNILKDEKREDETINTFEERLKSDAKKIMGLL